VSLESLSAAFRPWLRWVLALGAAEWAARALLSVMATSVGALVGEGPPARAQLFLAAAMLLAGVLEGALVGFAEAWAWGFGPASRSGRRLIASSALAFGVLWILGALASGVEPSAPSVGTLLAVAAGAGALLGAVLGACQALALPALGKGWVVANAFAWASGMLVGALVSQWVPDGPFSLFVLSVEMLSGVLTGVVVALSLFVPSRPLHRGVGSDG